MIALSWSGGKDSARALEQLREEGTPPGLLLTTVDEDSGRVTHHHTSCEPLRLQAEVAGLPLVEIAVPTDAGTDAYSARMRSAFKSSALRDVHAVAFGDLFLEDLREFRTQRLAEVGMSPLFPLWNRDTQRLAEEVIDRGYDATLVSVDPSALDSLMLGRRFDRELLSELPSGIDPCGENGEFHTFVSSCPCFSRQIAVGAGAMLERDGFPVLELLSANP